MLYRRQGFPEESEIVLCTVTKVLNNSVFCELDEYGKSGLIHISEIAPGRIRNLRDYVKEGKKVICKILDVNKEKGHINLSLRRVNEGLRRDKNNQIKLEMKAEKMIEMVSHQSKKPLKEVYDQIASEVFKKYDYIYPFFEEVSTGTASLDDLKLDKKVTVQLLETIQQKMKPPIVTVGGLLKLTSYAPEGITIVKKALEDGEKHGAQIHYLGAGRYNVKVVAEEYKDAEAKLSACIEGVTKHIQKHGTAVFERS